MPERIAGIFASTPRTALSQRRDYTDNSFGDQLVQLLIDPEIGYFDQVAFHDDLATADLRHQIETLFDYRKPYDLLLFYYIGPILVDNRHHVYLSTWDSNPDDLHASAVPLSFLSHWMSRTFSRRQIIILDQYADSSVNSVGLQNKIRNTLRGSNTWYHILLSEYQYHRKRSGPGHRTTMVTELFIQGLQSGNADINKDGVISTTDVHKYINQELRQAKTNHHVHLWSYHGDDVFILGNAVSGKQAKQLKPIVFVRALAAPAVILLIGWWADPVFAVEMALFFLLFFLAFYYFGD